MNKTSIEWCDYTWNPVTGCKHGCPYCYARKIAERFNGSKAWPHGFEPTFHPERLTDPAKMGKPQTIFVCSMADLFGEWVPNEWIRSVFTECVVGYQHTYIFLTKNPKRFLTTPGDFTRHHWLGATVTDAKDAGQRIHWLQRLPEGNPFISFEPLLGDPGPLNLTGIKQVIIGAQTKPIKFPEWNWVMAIQNEADRVGAKVFCKDSLSYLDEDGVFRRELCWQVHK